MTVNTRFYLFQLPPGVSYIFYEGIMEEVVFDERPMGLWNFVDGENNYVGALERYIQAVFFDEPIKTVLNILWIPPPIKLTSTIYN